MIVSNSSVVLHRGVEMYALVIASGSVTTTEPNLHVRQSCIKDQMDLPDVDRRFSFAQEVGQILLRLESTISFQEVKAREFCMSAIKHVQGFNTLTDVTSPIRRFLDQAITPAVGVGDPQSVNDVWT
jgi:hypothetical protein